MTLQPRTGARRRTAGILTVSARIGLILVIATCSACSVDPDPSASTPEGSAATRGASPGDGIERPIPSGEFSVSPVAETEPVRGHGDAADDAAIWIHPRDPARSIVIGTDVQEDGGLHLYDLDGREIGLVPGGRPNNVDLRGNVVVAGNRATNEIDVYRLDPTGPELEQAAAAVIEPGIDVYGSCLYESARDGALHVFVTSEDGHVEQWELVETDAGFEGQRRRAFELESQAEACVADDPVGVVYFAEEATGIWRFQAEPEASVSGELIATTEDGPLEADVEGLAIAAYPDGGGFLIGSSQGDDRFVIFDRRSHEHLATFSIEDASGIDEVSGTDGIEVTTTSLGPAFPGGLFVAQDGNNEGEYQNFKFVSLDDILR